MSEQQAQREQPEQQTQQMLTPDELNHLFTSLNALDVEQFYTAYQLWTTQQRIQALETQIDDLSYALAENTERLEQTHPTALALAALARLQSNGVSDVTILDRMLERGEAWLDRTMQHLDYCERIDVISGDYTKWCEHALDGAYDWIDSMQDMHDMHDVNPPSSPSIEAPDSASTVNEDSREAEDTGNSNASSLEQQPLDEATEELFLQKLMSDDSGDLQKAEDIANMETVEIEASMLETTLKIPMSPISPIAPIPHSPAPAETSSVPGAEPVEAQQPESAMTTTPGEQDTAPEAVESTPVLEETRAEHTNADMHVIAVEEEQQEQPSPPVSADEPEHAIVATQQIPDIAMLDTTKEPVAITPLPDEHVASPINAKTMEQTQEEHFEDTDLPEPLPPKKGVWRTLLATLLHI